MLRLRYGSEKTLSPFASAKSGTSSAKRDRMVSWTWAVARSIAASSRVEEEVDGGESVGGAAAAAVDIILFSSSGEVRVSFYSRCSRVVD
jgi:hypothetical protein